MSGTASTRSSSLFAVGDRVVITQGHSKAEDDA